MKKDKNLVPDICITHFTLALEIVSRYSGVERTEITSKKRINRLPLLRGMVFSMLRSINIHADIDIGSILGMDHTTVAHGVNVNYDTCETDPFHKKLYEECRKEFVDRIFKNSEEFNITNPSYFELIKKIVEIETALKSLRIMIATTYAEKNDIHSNLERELDRILNIQQAS
jgi:hypothetical protein